ncbi:XRE family transcriptional regulator [Bacillus methanolicus]|uniref:helix-turn-helix domain-containing protein n=1 Tax=Bacillus methanolicus TaxID=1471 RepID=UPI00200F6E2A|nr:helix-turn-helix transcriptional regulator [Bacillus methanolicus]UQD53393.1 XRE family transcriptional regulator [Bacillus methanolicus]
MKISVKNPDQIKTLLIINGFTQRNFAKEIQMTDSYLSQIIRGKKHPSIFTAEKICKKLDVDFNTIFKIIKIN